MTKRYDKEDAVKQWFLGIVIGLSLGSMAVTAIAQTAPGAPVATASGAQGVLDDTDKLLIEIVSVRAQFANCQADQLDSMKSFNATRAEVIKRIEEKHPGYTLDANGKLAAKSPKK